VDTSSVERRVAVTVRWATLLAVLASTVSAILMIGIGLQETAMAFQVQFTGGDNPLPASHATAVHLIGALSRFLMAIVLLYFAFGIYLLFIRPDAEPQELGVPQWLHVEGIGQLKQTLAQAIIVVLFVLFLRTAVETFLDQGLDFTTKQLMALLTLPLAIFLLSASLKLAELHSRGR
jgi:uncharacterized membrane protein YqhA